MVDRDGKLERRLTNLELDSFGRGAGIGGRVACGIRCGIQSGSHDPGVIMRILVDAWEDWAGQARWLEAEVGEGWRRGLAGAGEVRWEEDLKVGEALRKIGLLFEVEETGKVPVEETQLLQRWKVGQAVAWYTCLKARENVL